MSGTKTQFSSRVYGAIVEVSHWPEGNLSVEWYLSTVRGTICDWMEERTLRKGCFLPCWSLALGKSVIENSPCNVIQICSDLNQNRPIPSQKAPKYGSWDQRDC